MCEFLHLSEAGLAVCDVRPVFARHAVSQFVLPDKRPALGAGAALQPSCTLGNNAAHRLGHAEVRLQHARTHIIIIVGPRSLALSLREADHFPDPLPVAAALTPPVASAIDQSCFSITG